MSGVTCLGLQGELDPSGNKTSLGVDEVVSILQEVASLIEAEKDDLTRIDAAIGDGDHGVAMARGFREISNRLPQWSGLSVGDLFKKVGMTLLSVVGGATGPLFATIFIEAGKAVEEKTEIEVEDLARMFRAASNGITARTGAKVGDKTLLDALHPAALALEKAAENRLGLKRALNKAMQAAWDGVQSTKPLMAKHGKSRYLGERAVGYQDAGATSIYLILKAMDEWAEKNIQ